jgi:phosphatidylglycerol---prolipoprotein diacylglyceryl transferase
MHPILFKIGHMDIRLYSLMYILAIVLSFHFLISEISRKKIPLSKNEVLNLILVTVFAGILGARLYFVIFRWDYFSVNLKEILAIRNGGLASHGGFIAGIVAGYLYLKYYRVSFLKLADSALPLIVLGEACVRFGNFMNGEAHGLPTTVPWGVVFPPGSPAGIQFPNIPIHPTMLYQLFYNLLVFLMTWYVFRKKSHKDGFMAALTVILYSIGRYFIEGLRADSLYLGHCRVAQIMCIVLIFAMFIFIFGAKLWIKNPSAMDAYEGSKKAYKGG